jgi:2-phosphosulfolactate phosphatase
MGIFDQSEFGLRFEWGLSGLRALAPVSDTVVIVDILSFTTCVSIAVDRGAVVYPYQFGDPSAAAFARRMGAELSGERNRRPKPEYTLSPTSMLNVTEGTRLVLPSPNGSRLSFEVSEGAASVLAGSLRNAAAVGAAAAERGGTVAVIAAGEQWSPGDGLRPAAEDLWGAGAIIQGVPGERSPEAWAAVAAFERIGDRISEVLPQTSSGKELLSRGHEEDVALASQLNVSSTVPLLQDKAFVGVRTGGR